MRFILGFLSLAAFAIGVFWLILVISRPALLDILIVVICFALVIVFRAWRARMA